MLPILLIALLLLPQALAEKYYVMGLLKRGDQMVLDSFSVENIDGEITPSTGGTDHITVLSKGGDTLFSLATDLDSPELSLFYVPYQEEGELIELKDVSGNLLLGIPLEMYAKVCGDGFCQGQESWSTCPSDCKEPQEAQEIPIQNEEGDVSAMPFEEQPLTDEGGDGQEEGDLNAVDEENEGGGIGRIIMLALLAMVGGSGIFFWQRKKGHDEREAKIRKYVDYNMKKGYLFNQIAHTLKSRGITEEDIQNAMRRS